MGRKTGTVKATWPPHKRPLPSDVYGPLPNPKINWAKRKMNSVNDDKA